MALLDRPHELPVDRCLALAGPVQNATRFRQYLSGLNDRQLEERLTVLRADQQLRLPNGRGRDWLGAPAQWGMRRERGGTPGTAETKGGRW